MNEATDILRSCVRLVERLSGAASVSLYVTPSASGERQILLHEEKDLLPKLADEAAAAEMHNRFGDIPGEPDERAMQLPSRQGDGVMYRIPLGCCVNERSRTCSPSCFAAGSKLLHSP